MSEASETNPGLNEQQRDALLAGVQLNEGLDASSFVFDPTVGGLVIPTDDGLSRLVMFRSHRVQPDSNHTLAQASPPLDEKEARLSVFGTGYYLGNSAASVELFAWAKPDREIGVYQTPPLSTDQIKDIRQQGEKAGNLAWRLAALSLKSMLPAHRGAKRTANHDALYSESQLVAMDMNPFTYFAHIAQSQSPDHPVPPVWYLWRGSGDDITRIGTVTDFTLRKGFFQSLHQAAKALKAP